MRRSFPALPLLAALAIVAPLLLTPTPPDALAAPAVATVPAAAPAAAGDQDGPHPQVRRRAADSDPRTWQTSDRVIGPSAPPATGPGTARQRPSGRPRRVTRFAYRIAPGIRATSVQERNRRGTFRYSVVTARYGRRSVGLGLLQPSTIAATEKTSVMVRRTPRGVAGVNGDFFDIGDTGAPLGVGVRRSSVRHGRSHGWNAAFFLNSAGRPQIDTLPVSAEVLERPDLDVTNVNSAQVMPEGIGVYTPAWGRTAGLRWTDGQRRHVAMLQIKDGRVVRTATAFPAGREFQGKVLVARGRAQAALLRTVEVGDPLTVRWVAQGRPKMAITGNQIVLQGGRVLATDDVELHPRTAVGIDPRRRRIILLVVDGRQEFSDGYTMVQVAKRLRKLGARTGLNLDGGGSSTLIGHREGRLRVLNSPSDGGQRRVPNGLVVTSRIRPRS